MDVAGLLVNIPGLVEVCWKLGAALLETIKTYRDANKSSYLLADRFDMLWKNVSDIIATVQRIEDKLNERHEGRNLQNSNTSSRYTYECDQQSFTIWCASRQTTHPSSIASHLPCSAKKI